MFAFDDDDVITICEGNFIGRICIHRVKYVVVNGSAHSMKLDRIYIHIYIYCRFGVNKIKKNRKMLTEHPMKWKIFGVRRKRIDEFCQSRREKRMNGIWSVAMKRLIVFTSQKKNNKQTNIVLILAIVYWLIHFDLFSFFSVAKIGCVDEFEWKVERAEQWNEIYPLKISFIWWKC